MDDFGQFGHNPTIAEKPVLPIYAEPLGAVKISLHIELVVLLSLKFNQKNQIYIYCSKMGSKCVIFASDPI